METSSSVPTNPSTNPQFSQVSNAQIFRLRRSVTDICDFIKHDSILGEICDMLPVNPGHLTEAASYFRHSIIILKEQKPKQSVISAIIGFGHLLEGSKKLFIDEDVQNLTDIK